MKQHKIVIKETDIDWLGIIDLAFKRIDWGKTFTLYVCDTVSITCSMNEFDFRRNIATFRINCNYIDDNLSDDYENYTFVEYFIDNFTIDNFKRIILKKIKRLLGDIITGRTKRKARQIYAHLFVGSGDIDDEFMEEHGFLEDYEKIQIIDNNEIRDSCTDELINIVQEEANTEYRDKIDSYCASNKKSNINFDNLLVKINKLIGEK